MRTLEEVKGRCFITEDGHWLWRGSVRPDGRPNIFGPDYTRKNGEMRTQSGARAVWHMVNEKPVPKGNRVYVVCDNPTCCNPKRIRCTTELQYGLWVRRIGRHKAQPKRIAANRAICAKLTKLNSDQILYVQTSPKTGVALAAELGVSEQTISKARPRAAMVAGRARLYTPAKTEKYEARVALFAQQAMAGRAVMDGPVALSVTALFPTPPSWTKKRQAAARAGAEQHTKKPDLDNVLKTIKDGLNGVAWKDDSQVCVLRECRKGYSDTPRVLVTVEPIA